jgi:hypothetical protein
LDQIYHFKKQNNWLLQGHQRPNMNLHLWNSWTLFYCFGKKPKVNPEYLNWKGWFKTPAYDIY